MSRSERIKRYIQRQYMTEEGSVEGNVAALFDDELVYHVGGSTLGRADVVEAVHAVRRSHKTGRRVESYDFVEDRDTVQWRISAVLPGMGEDGTTVIQASELRADFNSDDKIQEVWSVDIE